jgi:hypothetical protein
MAWLGSGRAQEAQDSTILGKSCQQSVHKPFILRWLMPHNTQSWAKLCLNFLQKAKNAILLFDSDIKIRNDGEQNKLHAD